MNWLTRYRLLDSIHLWTDFSRLCSCFMQPKRKCWIFLSQRSIKSISRISTTLGFEFCIAWWDSTKHPLDDLWAVKLSCLQRCLLDQGKWSDLKLMEAWLRSWNITLNSLEVSLQANHLIFCTWISPFVQDWYHVPAMSSLSKNTLQTCKISPNV